MRDEAKQSTIKDQPQNANAPGWQAGYSDLSYDVNGHLIGAVDHVGNRTIRYVSDAQGQILLRDELAGNKVNKLDRYHYIDGQRVGDTGNTGPSRTDYAASLARHDAALSSTSIKGNDDKYANFQPVSSADFDQNYEPISASNPGAVAGDYTVKAGDTLQNIAFAVWGDSSLWYLIADANGLDSNSPLTAGQVLIVPNKVTNVHNNSSVYRVYNAGEAIGDTSPTIPDAPEIQQVTYTTVQTKKKKKHCGGFLSIIVAVVTVAVAVVTSNYELIPQALATTLGTTGTAIATAAVSASLGNIAGQVTGNILGVQKGFNFTSLATAAVTAGITQGLIGGTVNGVPDSGLYGDKLAEAFASSQYALVAARAVVGNVVNQGIGNLTGMQKGFSWASVAAAGVGAAAGTFIGGKVGNALKASERIGNATSTALSKTGSFITAASQGVISSLVSQLTQITLDGKGKLSWNSVAINGVSAGVGALAGYNDPKNGGVLSSRDIYLDNSTAANETGTTLDIPTVTVTAKRPNPVDTLVGQTADRLMQIDQLTQFINSSNKITSPSSSVSISQPSVRLPLNAQQAINTSIANSYSLKMNAGQYELRAWDGKGSSLPPTQAELNRQQAYNNWHYNQASNLSQSLPMASAIALPAKAAIASGMAINGVGNIGSQYIKYGEIKYPGELAISLGFGAAEGYLGSFAGLGVRGIVVEAGIGASSNVGAALTNTWYYKNDSDHQYNLLSEAGQGAVIGAAGKYSGDKYVIPFIHKYYPIK